MTIGKTFEKGLSVLMVIMAGIFCYLLIGLLRPLDIYTIEEVLFSKDTLWSIVISLSSIFCSMIIVSLLGTLLAYKLSGKKGKRYKLLSGMITLPLILPPTVAGLVLLQGFGRNSVLSTTFFNGQLQIPFHFIAIIFAQVYVTLPYYYQMTLNAFNDVDSAYLEAAKVCGADRFILLRYILIPISKKSMLAGLFLSALRGLSEFGATIMFAGNMAGKTQTMTTRIYQLYQTNIEGAFVLAGFQLVIFVVPYLFMVSGLRKGGVGDD